MHGLLLGGPLLEALGVESVPAAFDGESEDESLLLARLEILVCTQSHQLPLSAFPYARNSQQAGYESPSSGKRFATIPPALGPASSCPVTTLYRARSRSVATSRGARGA